MHLFDIDVTTLTKIKWWVSSLNHVTLTVTAWGSTLHVNSDVCEVDPRTVRVQIYITAVDP